VLVDDRIGSRVGDRCWTFADPYLKEKIARSLIPHESFLAGSFYGKFFARNLSLHLLQRRPEDWKTMQAERKRASQGYPTAATANFPHPEPEKPTVEKKRKRKALQEDDIDAVFNQALGKKSKKGALESSRDTASHTATSHAQDDALDRVLGAIRSAPRDDKSRGVKKCPR